jgi:hypothetical protein
MKIIHIETCGIELSKGVFISFFHSYNNEFYTTLQIEPSYLLVSSHNLLKCRIDMKHSDSFIFS